MRTSIAAISFLAGLVAANGGYGDYEPSTVVLTSTDVQTITSCAGGCEHTSVSAPPVHTPVVPTTLVHPSETPVVPELPETCVPTTVTVTVTLPHGPSGTPPVVPSQPPVVPSQPPVVPSQPPHSSVSPPSPTVVLPPVVPSVPSTPTPTPSPPTFTGAASNLNAGVFVAGVGAFAALFL